MALIRALSGSSGGGGSMTELAKGEDITASTHPTNDTGVKVSDFAFVGAYILQGTTVNYVAWSAQADGTIKTINNPYTYVAIDTSGTNVVVKSNVSASSLKLYYYVYG